MVSAALEGGTGAVHVYPANPATDGRLSSTSHRHSFQNLPSFTANTVIKLQVATLKTPETTEKLEIHCCSLSDIFTSLLSVKLI